jgi:ABC-type dipeptide/oligopeptide/nickel transport system permease component
VRIAFFVARRLLTALPILFGVLLFTFMLVRVGGQDPVGLLAGPTATEEDVAAVKQALKLDQPIWTQFAEFSWRVAHGDLGRSWLSGKPVSAELLMRLPATLEIVIIGSVLGAAIAVPVGLIAAFRPNGWFDHISRAVSLFGFSIPTYYLGLVAIFVFFFLLRLAPPPMGRIDLMITAPPLVTGSYLIDALIAGDGEAALSAAGRLVLPCICIVIVYAGPLIKQMRAIAVDILQSDYVRYARASGLGERLIRNVVWRNARVPMITYMATELIGVFGTASVLELIFSWGGLSQFGLNAITHGDFAVVQGYVLLMALIAMAVFALVDLLVLWLEPRSQAL